MAKTKKKWLYKKNGRFYGDFRSFADVGGGQEALKPDGERYATKDYRVAKALAKTRLAELRRLRKAGHAMEDADLRLLGPFVDYHLEQEAMRQDADPAHLAQVEQRLNAAIEFFGEDALLRSISTMVLQGYVNQLPKRLRWEGTENESADTIKASTQRKYLSDLSKLFKRARSVEIIPGSHKPFKDLMNPPNVDQSEAEWLDGPTAVLLLEAARLYRPKRPDIAIYSAYAAVATLLLTGMRPSEGLGLQIEDIDFERKLIRVRRNRHRRLKNKSSRRVVPLWPQLEVILREYLESLGNPTSGILFPSPRNPGRPVKSIKRLMAELTERIGHEAAITPKIFRHTYCAARLQTTDRGQPIALLKVARELGHRDTTMVEYIYGHIDSELTSFPRKPHVSFDLEEYAEVLGDRLEALQERTARRNGYPPTLVNRVPLAVELAVLDFARTSPRTGPRKASEALTSNGFEVSPSGVRWIWKRYELHRSEYRLEAIETGRLDEVMEEVRELRGG